MKADLTRFPLSFSALHADKPRHKAAINTKIFLFILFLLVDYYYGITLGKLFMPDIHIHQNIGQQKDVAQHIRNPNGVQAVSRGLSVAPPDGMDKEPRPRRGRRNSGYK
jgi:hypothetical protein